jgi:DNA-binding winged helix-turn-helix (wHTH) protein/TolB-like protein
VTYEFGPFRYDAVQRLLFRDGELVPVVPKALETLHVLLERRGTIVEKAELMRLVWPDTTVEEVGLARNISLLRKTLGDYIETIPKRGYRFPAAPAHEPEPEPLPTRARRWPWLLGAAGALVAVFVYYQFYVPSRYLPWARASLAVVPFDCLCSGVDANRLTRVLNEALVAEISKSAGVQVVSPATVHRYQRAGISMSVMARLLGLEVLVEGTVQTAGGARRTTVRLTDVHTGRIIWSETYEEPENTAFENTGRSVAAEVGKRLTR